jgi:hypothetical protein
LKPGALRAFDPRPPGDSSQRGFAAYLILKKNCRGRHDGGFEPGSGTKLTSRSAVVVVEDSAAIQQVT